MNARGLIRTTVSMAACLTIALGLMRPANAQPRTDATLSVSPGFGPPASPFKVQGNGFQAGESVAVHFDTWALVQAMAGRNGAFTATAHVPSAAGSGVHGVSALGL